MNAALLAKEAGEVGTLCTHSSGNHGAALAEAGRILGFDVSGDAKGRERDKSECSKTRWRRLSGVQPVIRREKSSPDPASVCRSGSAL